MAYMANDQSNYKPLSTAKPRRPCSAYAFYVQENYRYQTRTTGVRDAASVFPLIYEDWRQTTEEERVEYVKRAKADVKRYKKEMVVYCKLLKKGLIEPERKKPRKTDQEGYPRMTKSAYIFFSNEVRPEIREENPDMPYEEVVKEIARRWHALDDDGKDEYRRMRNQDRNRYRAQRRQLAEAKKTDEKAREHQERQRALATISEQGRPKADSDGCAASRIANVSRVGSNSDESI